MLYDLTQLGEVVIVVDPQQELCQVGRTLMIILEIAEELEHLVRLPLKVDFEFPEFGLERRVLHLLLVDASE